MPTIPYNNNWKRIGISLSGGADSALLAYLVLKNTTADLYFTTQIRLWKTRPWQRPVAHNVVDWFKEQFPERNITHLENFIPPEMEEPNTTYITDEYGYTKPGNRIILRAFNEWAAHTYNLDAWFAGVNKNPDVPFDGALADREEGHLPLVMEHMGITVCHPFVHTMKDWIIQQYYTHDIVDLLKLTRSCEGDLNDYPEVFGDLDYKTYTPGQSVPECGKCFWCKEREWAIEKATK